MRRFILFWILLSLLFIYSQQMEYREFTGPITVGLFTINDRVPIKVGKTRLTWLCEDIEAWIRETILQEKILIFERNDEGIRREEVLIK